MKLIRKIIQEELSKIFSEDFRYRYDGSYTPPENVINTCKKALDIVNKNDLIKKQTLLALGVFTIVIIMVLNRVSRIKNKKDEKE
jgi:hypothetical protein